MLKQFIAAIAGAAFIGTMPAAARVESRTGDLLRLLNDEYGVTVQTNPADNCGGAMGRFSLKPRPIMQICYQGKGPTAEDHEPCAMRHGIIFNGVNHQMLFLSFLA